MQFVCIGKALQEIRDSGHEDQELSALHQERSIRTRCDQNGCELTRIFVDERPGSSAQNRTAFQEMMTYFRQPGVPEVALLVWSFSRFAKGLIPIFSLL